VSLPHQHCFFRHQARRSVESREIPQSTFSHNILCLFHCLFVYLFVLQSVCPLCCEELDLSDQSFYPCPCGYQVCMWCWHRIKESESGLCPACRSPYGEDPHQFSAVDVEAALKANKLKEDAVRNQSQHAKHQNISNIGHHSLNSLNSSHSHSNTHPHNHQNNNNSHSSSNGSSNANNANSSNNQNMVMEAPKDRTLLANMRVIRRNLIYAVGLPPSIANEETLRKPEYFGQYGRIAKMVLNRNNVTASNTVINGEIRRASASAYVTFAHKEDTLACILALDGLVLDHRSVRVSYGTSKYCSSFIKSVRCNNPECTYLHEMGAEEDTFTKQEIQAGYVTSGRDVLARQQQILAEQLLLAGAGASGTTRSKSGGGGPSGTGKHASHPIFPPSVYDEPARPTPPLVPPPVGIPRATTVTAPSLPTRLLRTQGRSASVGNRSPTLAATPAPNVGNVAGGQVRPVTHSGTGVSAASVVAGVRPAVPVKEESHTTLTPLTPLKRTKGAAKQPPPVPSATETTGLEKLAPLRNGKKNSKKATPNGPPIASFPSSPGNAVIGGDVIGPLQPVANVPGGDRSGRASALADLHHIGDPLRADLLDRPERPSALGGEIFTGELPSNRAIGGSLNSGYNDKWNASGGSFSSGPALSTESNGLGGLWSSNSMVGAGYGNSSSALASILGINLPTGSGSLQQSTNNLWTQSPPSPFAPGPSPLSTLNNSALPTQNITGLGHSAERNGSSLIGGVPIGGGSSALHPSEIGNGGSDIALLQSLLPGVHITTGRGDNWGLAPGPVYHQNNTNSNDNWINSGGISGHGPHGSVGAIGRQENGSGQQQRQQQHGPGIW
jgi:hypothetical protein